MEGDEAWGSSAIIVGANAPPELGMASHVMAWSAPTAGQHVPYGLQRGFQRAPAAADPRAGFKWGLGGDVPGVVPKIPRFSPAGGSMTP
jgi:hypothetical protein